jgi:hypothetical protein
VSGYLYALTAFPIGKEPPLPATGVWLAAGVSERSAGFLLQESRNPIFLALCPETSVRNYHYTLSYSPEKRTSHFHRGGILKSRQVLRLSLVFQKFKRPSCWYCSCWEIKIGKLDALLGDVVGRVAQTV